MVKTLLKWMIWGENPPFSETPIHFHGIKIPHVEPSKGLAPDSSAPLTVRWDCLDSPGWLAGTLRGVLGAQKSITSFIKFGEASFLDVGLKILSPHPSCEKPFDSETPHIHDAFWVP